MLTAVLKVVSDIDRLTRAGQGPLTPTGKGGERGSFACRWRREKLSTLRVRNWAVKYELAGGSTGGDVKPVCLTWSHIIEDQVLVWV